MTGVGLVQRNWGFGPWKKKPMLQQDRVRVSLTAEEKKQANQKMCKELGLTHLVPKNPKTKENQEAVAEELEATLVPVLRALVDRPRELGVTITVTTTLVSVEIDCVKTDASFLVGRTGKMADSLRTVFGGIVRRHGYHLILIVPDKKYYEKIQNS